MENAYEEHLCLCALQNQFGFEPKIPLALIDRLGSAAAVFSLDHESLREIFGPYGKQDLITKQALDDADKVLSTLPPDCRFIGFGEPGYPTLLAECPDPPAGIYYTTKPPSQWRWATSNFSETVPQTPFVTVDAPGSGGRLYPPAGL